MGTLKSHPFGEQEKQSEEKQKREIQFQEARTERSSLWRTHAPTYFLRGFREELFISGQRIRKINFGTTIKEETNSAQ